MIVDSSALLAVVLEEPDGDDIARLIMAEDAPLMSAASDVECALRLDGQLLSGRDHRLDEAIARFGITLSPLTEEHALLARRAFEFFGKGRHAAGLNFGDCLSYALAKATGRPLLCKGDDFLKTDLG